VAACNRGLPIPERDLLLRITAGADVATVGRAFPLTVVRVFSKDLEPGDLPEEAFAPLVLRLLGTGRREDDRRIEETRRYDAYAFAAGDVVLREIPFIARPRNGGPEREVPGNALRIKVVATLDPAAPGAIELPGEPIRGSFPWRPVGLGGGAALAGIAVALVLWRRAVSRPAPSAGSSTPPPGPEVRALARLGRLRSAAPRDVGEAEALCVEASGAVRDYLDERFALPAGRRTTEELGALVPLAGPEAERLRVALRAALRPADFVKFARLMPEDPEREAMLDGAEEFVRKTSPVAAAPAGEPA
jgi:hypothetical protein